jgi:hypothetical protein
MERIEIKLNMTAAMCAWLAAREEWLTGTGSVRLDNFRMATDLLYVAFLEDTNLKSDSRIAGDAFHKFRNYLAEEFDKGIPYRVKKFHPNPTMVGHA